MKTMSCWRKFVKISTIVLASVTQQSNSNHLKQGYAWRGVVLYIPALTKKMRGIHKINLGNSKDSVGNE